MAAARANRAVATSRPVVLCPPSTRRAQAKNGTIAIRSTVSALARFQADGPDGTAGTEGAGGTASDTRTA